MFKKILRGLFLSGVCFLLSASAGLAAADNCPSGGIIVRFKDTGAKAIDIGDIAGIDSNKETIAYLNGSTTKNKSNSTLSANASAVNLKNFIATYKTTIKADSVLPRLNVALLSVTPNKNILPAIKKDPTVKYVVCNESRKLSYAGTDPDADCNYFLNNTGGTTKFCDGKDKTIYKTKTGADIKWLEAQDYLKQNNINLQPVTVAVVDSGVAYDHPELKPTMWDGSAKCYEPGLDMEPVEIPGGCPHHGYAYSFGYPDDNDPRVNKDYLPLKSWSASERSHGTHIAGIIAGVKDNKIGALGIANNAKIMAMQAVAKGGFLDSFSTARAYYFAMLNGAKIINYSAGGPGQSQFETEVIDDLKKGGVLLVVAAGNDGLNNDIEKNTIYPCGYKIDNVICVANSNYYDELYFSSNYGSKTVHLAAPGDIIYAPVIMNTADNGLAAKMAEKTGTSMAAPMVAGVAAVLWGANPNANYQDIKAAILNSVDKLPSLNGKVITGGRLNLYRALQSVKPTVSLATCTDSDGSNTLTKGSVTGLDTSGQKYTKYDECLNKEEVKEYECADIAGGGRVYKTTSVYCVYGCLDGACIKSITKCEGTLPAFAVLWGDGTWYSFGLKTFNYQATDSSLQDCDFHCLDGYDYKNNACVKKEVVPERCKGVLPDNAAWWANDSKDKAPYWEGKGSKEANFQETNKTSEDCDFHCQDHYKYVDGKCTPAYTGKTTCLDTDGENIFSKGYVKGIDWSGSEYLREDECHKGVKNDSVSEFVCYKRDDGNAVSGQVLFDCPGSCQDGACVKANVTNTCTDKNGESPFIKDSVEIKYAQGGSGVIWDTCSGKVLKEVICASTASAYGYKEINCANGCQDGACVKANVTNTCTDKNGESPFIKDSVEIKYAQGGSGIFWDTCFGTKLKEAICVPLTGGKGSGYGYKETNCQFGCEDGACLKKKDVFRTCTDSDNDNLYNKGFVTGQNEKGEKYTSYDECLNSDKQVREYICTKSGDETVSGFVVKNCQYGCQNGACLKQALKTKCLEAFPANAKWWGDGYWYGQGTKSAHYREVNSKSEDCDYYCDKDYEYKNGLCLKKSTNVASCTDPDGGSTGDALYKASTAIHTRPGGRSTYADKCLLKVKSKDSSGRTVYKYEGVSSCSGINCNLQEGFCDGVNVSNIARACANGCKNGACVPAVKGVKIDNEEEVNALIAKMKELISTLESMTK